jgi:hypothetical protein
LQNINKEIKPRRWARHVTHMGQRRNAYKIVSGKPKNREHLGDLCKDERVILKRIINK